MHQNNDKLTNLNIHIIRITPFSLSRRVQRPAGAGANGDGTGEGTGVPRGDGGGGGVGKGGGGGIGEQSIVYVASVLIVESIVPEDWL